MTDNIRNYELHKRQHFRCVVFDRRCVGVLYAVRICDGGDRIYQSKKCR